MATSSATFSSHSNSVAGILLAIPDIFKDAEFTLVHLYDVSSASARLLRSRKPEKRLQGVTSVCNGRWFRRMWTAMEFIRSANVRVLLEDYRIFEGGNDLFLGEMETVWGQEVQRLGNALYVEDAAGASENLVPWMLGPLQDVRLRKATVFAHAFTLLSTRQCSEARDFFYGLLGILRMDLKETELEDGDKTCLQIARGCLAPGDYSPLLMLPRKLADYRFHAFHDVSPWGLGAQTSAPSITDGLVVRPQISFAKPRILGPSAFAGIFPLNLEA